MKCINKKNLNKMMVYYLITGGLYGLIWIMTRGYCIYFKENDFNKKKYYFSVIFFVICYFLFLFTGKNILTFYGVENHIIKLISLILFFSAFLIYLLVGFIAVDIAKYIKLKNPELVSKISPALIILLTFIGFTSIFYIAKASKNIPLKEG